MPKGSFAKSKSRKKSETLLRKVGENLKDVTLAEFADSKSDNRYRVSKAATKLLQKVDKDAVLESNGEILDDLDILSTENLNAKKKNVKSSENGSKEEDTYNDTLGEKIFTLDLWFKISEYIRPEDVKNFSLICRSSYYVVNRPIFWINLYKRHYQKICDLPKRLMPNCLDIHNGLKATVIQAIFYTYAPLRAASEASTYVKSFDKLNELIGRQCILMWIEKAGKSCEKWIYHFKFRRSNYQSSTNGVRLLNNIHQNTEDGCQILRVPCNIFIAFQCINGLKVKMIKGSLTNLKFVFNSLPYSKSSTGDVIVALNPSGKLSLLDWWHPMYHSRG